MENQIKGTADALSRQIAEFAETKNKLIELKAVAELTKAKLFVDSKEVEGLKTVADKENWVKLRLYEDEGYHGLRILEQRLHTIEARIEALKYKFRSYQMLVKLMIIKSEKNDE